MKDILNVHTPPHALHLLETERSLYKFYALISHQQRVVGQYITYPTYYSKYIDYIKSTNYNLVSVGAATIRRDGESGHARDDSAGNNARAASTQNNRLAHPTQVSGKHNLQHGERSETEATEAATREATKAKAAEVTVAAVVGVLRRLLVVLLCGLLVVLLRRLGVDNLGCLLDDGGSGRGCGLLGGLLLLLGSSGGGARGGGISGSLLGGLLVRQSLRLLLPALPLAPLALLSFLTLLLALLLQTKDPVSPRARTFASPVLNYRT